MEAVSAHFEPPIQEHAPYPERLTITMGGILDMTLRQRFVFQSHEDDLRGQKAYR